MTAQGSNLIFIFGSPRSGSTLLQRMVASHSAIVTHPEPHLMTPLAYLGYYDRVERAPYDHINAGEAIRAFVSNLPGKEEDYLEALRGYASTLYNRFLSDKDAAFFLDKTPAYALVWSFIIRVFPKARYIALTRHPFAIFSSYAKSFFSGDWKLAYDFNPILERYVPAISGFLQQKAVPYLHVRYEDVVTAPEETMEKVFKHIGVEVQLQAVNYGAQFQNVKGMGDPVSVGRHARPNPDLKNAWQEEMRQQPDRAALAARMLAALNEADLASWDYSKDELSQALRTGSEVPSVRPRKKVPLTSYQVKRKVMLALKKNIDHRLHGKVVRRVRYYCDVLLRDVS